MRGDDHKEVYFINPIQERRWSYQQWWLMSVCSESWSLLMVNVSWWSVPCDQWIINGPQQSALFTYGHFWIQCQQWCCVLWWSLERVSCIRHQWASGSLEASHTGLEKVLQLGIRRARLSLPCLWLWQSGHCMVPRKKICDVIWRIMAWCAINNLNQTKQFQSLLDNHTN